MLYAVFTKDVADNIDLIDKIKSFFEQQYNAKDFVIFTDDVTVASNNNAILTTFYMIAYEGSIVFLDINDYYAYEDQLKNNGILYLDQNSIESLDHNSIKKCSILTQNNNTLEWIKTYEL